MSEPTLSDDEQALQRYAEELYVGVEATVGDWIRRSVAAFDPALAASEATDAAVASGRAAICTELRNLLVTDIADQRVGPLQVLRQGVRFATDVLRDAGVEPVGRDDFAVRSFPDDIYGLAPATFADVDPALHEPGLVWGAAKAHVHLRRRREAAAPRVVVLSVDLMDRSKISAALPDAGFVRSVTELVAAADDASLVLVDLARVGELSALADVRGRVIAFGSHVEEARLAAAAETGAQVMARSVFFRRVAAGEL